MKDKLLNKIITGFKEWLFGIDVMKIRRILDRPVVSEKKMLAIAECIINSATETMRIISSNSTDLLKTLSIYLVVELTRFQLKAIQVQPDNLDHFQNRNKFQLGGIVLNNEGSEFHNRSVLKKGVILKSNDLKFVFRKEGV